MLKLVRKKTVIGILFAIGITNVGLQAEPFKECPADAFLIQDKLANHELAQTFR